MATVSAPLSAVERVLRRLPAPVRCAVLRMVQASTAEVDDATIREAISAALAGDS